MPIGLHRVHKSTSHKSSVPPGTEESSQEESSVLPGYYLLRAPEAYTHSIKWAGGFYSSKQQKSYNIVLKRRVIKKFFWLHRFTGFLMEKYLKDLLNLKLSYFFFPTKVPN